MSRHLADATRDPAVLKRAQARQRTWAAERLASDPSIGTLIMSHTHRACQAEFDNGGRYVNPGAWIGGRCHAVVTARSAELRRFD
jgi:UDP-2,3-diacylglucosamine pyrophosphatase LpxH